MIVVSQITEVLCDTCYEAAVDSGYACLMPSEIITFCMESGSRLLPHECEQRTGGLFKFERCVCACDKEGHDY